MTGIMNLGDLEFKAEDAELKKAYSVSGTTGLQTEIEFISIEKANALLRERLEKALKVYGWPDNSKDMYYANWGTLSSPKDTHTARLVCIEELKK